MRARFALIFGSILGLAACGGGGGDSAATNALGGTSNPGGSFAPFPVSGPPYTAGLFSPASTFKNWCATPRAGTNPLTGQAYADLQGSAALENFWLRSWTNETYLWYSEVSDLNPSLYTTAGYFPLLKTAAVTPSGNPKDQFHFTYPTAQWIALSQSGVQSGYGVQWFVISAIPPRRIVVAYVEPGSPAASLTRGDEIVAINGIDVINSNSQQAIDILNASVFPTQVGQTYSFTLRPVSGPQYSISLQSRSDIVSDPVQNVSVLNAGTDPVGYLVFNDHIATSEAQLIAAINQLKTADVTDLILDIRYNGGGYLDIASELAYMIAGPVPTAGRTFERLTFNDKHPNTDPVTGQALTPIPFHTTTQGFSAGTGAPLPTLNLQRVFVITGSGTCSASESIINGLRGVDVEVIQIGMTTCGKPYGFYPTDNCGTTYFTIQMTGVNAKGFGAYSDGFTPNNSIAGWLGEPLPGCSVNDDFTHVLGDPAEGKLAAALQYRATGTCPSAPSSGPVGLQKSQLPVDAGFLARPAAREIRVLREQ